MNNNNFYLKYKKYKKKYIILKKRHDNTLISNIDIESPIIEFVKEGERRSHIIYGENYAPEYDIEGVGDPRVGFFFKLVRNLSEEDIHNFINSIVKKFILTKDKQLLIDLIIMTFQTRDIRGGKGERKIFYYTLIELYNFIPETILNLLALIPFYGYFKDYFNILEIIEENETLYYEFINKIFDLVFKQFDKDIKEYKKNNKAPKLSLLSKYIPKEKKHFDKKYNFVERFVERYFLKKSELYKLDKKQRKELIYDAKKKYRKYISKLNKALDTPEILMSAKKFAEITFSKVASKCIFRYRKAFLNETIEYTKEDNKDNKLEDIYDDPDRKKCRKNFIDAIKSKKINGKQLEIYEIVKVVEHQSDLSKEEVNLFQVPWDKIKEDIINKIGKPGLLGNNNLLPIIDVSGSMNGIPMYVAISLGILLTELNIGPLKDKFITFSENPEWVNLNTEKNIVEKIKKTLKSNWGMGTDFEYVYEMIIDIVKTKKLSQEQIPDLIVLSDMQFDEARRIDNDDRYVKNNNKKIDFGNGTWSTHHEKIVQIFKEVGEEISGKPYDPPKIIYWNLRSGTIGFPMQAHTPNVQMLSGFSPNLFKHVLAGEDLSKFPIPTPYSILRNVLDDDRYDIIKEIIYYTKEIDVEKIEKLSLN